MNKLRHSDNGLFNFSENRGHNITAFLSAYVTFNFQSPALITMLDKFYCCPADSSELMMEYFTAGFKKIAKIIEDNECPPHSFAGFLHSPDINPPCFPGCA